MCLHKDDSLPPTPEKPKHNTKQKSNAGQSKENYMGRSLGLMTDCVLFFVLPQGRCPEIK